MFVTDDDDLAKRARLLRGQGMDINQTYWHTIIGYNYRMMNLSAAIGLAQLERIDEHLSGRADIAKLYQEHLRELPGVTLQVEQNWAKHVYWMFSVVFEPEFWQDQKIIADNLKERGIETRPFFYPGHILPPYADPAKNDKFPIAENLSVNGLSLPTWTGLTENNINYICDSLKSCRI